MGLNSLLLILLNPCNTVNRSSKKQLQPKKGVDPVDDDYWPRLGWWHISDEDWELLKVKAVKKIIEERLAKKGIPSAEFYEKLDLLVKASALARVGGKLPEKFYKDGFTFLKAGKGYVVVKGPIVKGPTRDP
jgi:hypothetical protein